MNKFNRAFLAIFLIFNCNIFAQAPSDIKALEQKYLEYFQLNREVVFLHLNKTSVVPKENLWFSAYVYNPKKSIPNRETVNLQVQIFDEKGKYMDSQTVLVSDGKGSGFIDLDTKKFSPGDYVLKASTNYMRNFDEDLSFFQPFTIIGKERQEATANEEYDLQLLPEGGHLLEDVINTVGVKLINNLGTGVFFTDGKVVGPNNNIVTTFKSNQFGISKFSFKPLRNEDYTILLTTENGREISQKIIRPEATGIALTSTERPAEFVFSVKSNAATRASLNEERFNLAIHKDGLIKNVAFMFPENSLEANIAVGKDSLFPGVNTVTVFNEKLQPVLERMVFNDNNLKRSNLSGKMINNKGDSLVIKLSSTPATQNASLSVSVLPSETKAYNPQHNIFSAFYLEPYLNGRIENASWYFSPENERRKKYELDLLLLAQGWSAYSWKNIFHNAPRELYQPEIAFGIEGRIMGRNSKKDNTLFIKSEETGLFEIVEIQDDDTFRLNNIYLLDSTEISFGLLNDRNDKVKKPGISYRIFPVKQEKDLLEPYKFPFRKKQINNKFRPEDFPDTSVSLDTVMLNGVRKNTEKYQNETRVFDESLEITEEIASRYYLITDYIASKGFRVIRTPFGVEIINNIPFSLSPGANPTPLIIFNGMPITNSSDFLVDLQSSQVESIVINKRGVGYGMQGGNGVIKITTKKGPGSGRNSDTIESIITSNGFSENKRFYTPKYRSYDDDLFKEYGAISWIPNLYLETDGSTTFSVMNSMQPEVKLFVEGMNAEGVLFSDILTVKLQ